MEQYRAHCAVSSVSATGRVVAVAKRTSLPVAPIFTPDESGACFTLAFPAKELFPNRSNGRHWGGKQAAKEKARSEGQTIARVWALRNDFVPVKDRTYALRLEFVQDKCSRDLDNMLAALKPALDGVALGLQINDRQFKPITITTYKGEPCVRLRIEVNE